MARNGHQRALNQLNILPILSVALHEPALWSIVTEAIYDVQESGNCPRSFGTHFSWILVMWQGLRVEIYLPLYS